MSSVVHNLEAKTSRWTGWAACFVTILMLATAFAGAFGTQRLYSSEADVAKSHRLHIGLERLLSLLRDAETGQRGYRCITPTERASRKRSRICLSTRPNTRRLDRRFGSVSLWEHSTLRYPLKTKVSVYPRMIQNGSSRCSLRSAGQMICRKTALE